MKKLIFAFILCTLAVSSAHAADQWTKGDPQGTEASGTIDDIIRINQEALDRLLKNYRTGAYGYSTGSGDGFSVSAGDLTISNSTGSVRRFRSNTSATTVTWSNMDSGSGDTVSTRYAYYAVADTDATTWTVMISSNLTTPTGATYYRKLGEFYNNSSGSIEIGGIIEMFSGYISNIPPGYVLCDGTNGTPDLRDRFVFGAGNRSAVNDKNTNTTFTLSGTGSAVTYTASSGFGAGSGSNVGVYNDYDHMVPYYALAYVMRQGVE